MHWFYDPNLSPAAIGSEGSLAGSEGYHASGPLRIRVGERICITNGRGLIAACEASAIAKGELFFRILELTAAPVEGLQIWLYQALAKGDRDELAIQSATELGVAGIGAWQAARSVSRWDGPKIQKGLDRWRQITIDAAKQSQRAWIPEVAAGLCLGLPNGLPGITAILEPSAAKKFTDLEIPKSGRFNLVVGPEGGFTPEELGAAVTHGYQVVKLGDEILRTSTAGPAAIAALHAMTGRW